MSKKKKENRRKYFVDGKEVDAVTYFANIYADPEEAAKIIKKKKTGKNIVTGRDK